MRIDAFALFSRATLASIAHRWQWMSARNASPERQLPAKSRTATFE